MAASSSVAAVHYAGLRRYLEEHLLKEKAGVSKQRQSARDKLKGLKQHHFQELSTDVYDEMSRRLLDSPDVPFLPVRDDFHPKRNQARQKLATLQTSRFKDLASDVFCELLRRYPDVVPKADKQEDHWTSDEEGVRWGGDMTLVDERDKEAGARSRPSIDGELSQDRQKRPSELKSGYAQQQSPGSSLSPALPRSTGSTPFSPGATYGFTSPMDHLPSAGAAVRRGSETVTTTIFPHQQSATVLPQTYTVQNSYDEPVDLPGDRWFGSPSTKDSSAADEYPVTESLLDARRNVGQAGSKAELLTKPPTLRVDALISSTTSAVSAAIPEPAVPQKGLSGGVPKELHPTKTGVADIRNGSEVNFAGLDSLMADLGDAIRDEKLAKEEQVVSPKGRSATSPQQQQRTVKNSRSDIEEKVGALTSRIAELEEDAKRRNMPLSNLQEAVMKLRETNAKQAQEFRLLKQEHEGVMSDVNEYKRILKEAKLQLEELKTGQAEIARNLEKLRAEKDRNTEVLENITEENAQLRRELSGAMDTARNLHDNASLSPQALPASLVYVAAAAQADHVLVPQDSGTLEPGKLAAYQAAVYDLLRAARGEEPSAVLMAMKSVVISCKSITEDLERFQAPTDEAADRVQAVKAGFADTLGSLFASAKAHAAGFDDKVNPATAVALDANAGRLTAAILEFAKILRVRKPSSLSAF